ncbi:uncharacterized protein FA14DRAFT_13142 [Meira miltonrushii]|uniref:dolichol kinase n=1 Tax=Meira miltonrushii TaxID=1280837 RepID=A0A316VIA6_9BASI|nr:uncharacterized protein FA14DRAFT_13142 [Meira miltonrushii]PWN37332.1 hypothetical protein FA14DRAFT_13142 [Meira miltonrushii]
MSRQNTSLNGSHGSSSRLMQVNPASSNLQKTWSNDSLANMLKPTVLRNPPPVEIDRPRKHARRTSLPVRSDRTGPSSQGNGMDGARRHSIERKRFRDSVQSSGKLHLQNGNDHSFKSRRESAPGSSRPTVRRGRSGHEADMFSRSKMFGIGEEGDDEDDDDEIEEVEHADTDEVGDDTANSIGRLSAIETSTTYAAGPSESGRRRTIDDGSSSDASSSERQAFDWDVPPKRLTPITPHTGSLQVQQRSGYSYDSAERTSSPRRRSLQLNSARDGSCPSTPTKREKELESSEYPAMNTLGLSRISQQNLKATNGINGKSAETAWARARLRWPSNATFEGALLVGACVIMAYRLYTYADEATKTHACEVMSLVVGSIIYYLFLRNKNENGSIWATHLRQYRACGDDGAMLGLLLGPLLGVTCLFASLEDRPAQRLASGDGLPFPPWRVETPALVLGNRTVPHPTMTALALSRCTLLSLQTAMSTTLLVHLLATKYIRKPEEISTSSWKRLWSCTKFAFVLSVSLTLLREAFSWIGIRLWTGLTRGELLTSTLFFQSNLYTVSQLGRRSFTLGELSIVASVGVTLAMEALNLTTARLLPGMTPYVKTFRRPTPLLTFQLALVVGTFMIGFLLSPLLYLSRHLAQKPVHRLRWPHKRDLHRRLLAFFFYLFSALYVVGVLGLWVYWVLDKRNPWLWTFNFVISGQRWWSRPVLIAYWIGLVSITVVGWQATVLSGKRFRIRTGASNNANGISNSSTNHQTVNAGRIGATPVGAPGSSANEPLEVGFSKMKSMASSASGDLSAAANQLFPKRAAYLSLNARRKFFHALAVLMFAPGIAFDPAFMHLAFSLAFSVFIFAEYVRYYALYPFGAALHIFLSEFTDHKDSGPVILSHFYLLTGCAGGLWIDGLHGTSTKAGQTLSQQIISSNGSKADAYESIWTTVLGTFNWYDHQLGVPSLPDIHLSNWTKGGDVDISMFIGVLVLGVGDALASIIGRRYGRVRWPNSGKTLEGSVAFIVSIFASAIFLRLIGWCAPFSLVRFGIASIILGLFEGISNQNDNLILPIYGVIALSVMQV